MTPEEIDAAHDEARAETNKEAMVRKFAARPEWALGMCSSCQEWIHPLKGPLTNAPGNIARKIIAKHPVLVLKKHVGQFMPFQCAK